MCLEQLESIAVKILVPFLIGWIFFKIVESLTKKISIKNYEYDGMDLVGGRTKVVWYIAENNRNIDGIEYDNDKYYFRVYTQFFKEGMSRVLAINMDEKDSYDFSTIVIFNKNDLKLKIRFKLLKWLILEYVKNKIEPSRKKVLPGFLIKPYVFTDALYLNMETLFKKFKTN